MIFGRFQLDTAGERLWRGKETISLKPKAFSVLRYLVENPDRLVSKDELLNAVWSEVSVSDAVLKVCIGELRRALGDNPRTPQFIETVHRRGYRFIAPVFAGKGSVTRAVNPISTVPFVGRQQEMNFLRDAFRSAAAGTGGIVCISAEAGLGKTTLVHRFMGLLRADLPDIFIGRGRSFERLAGTAAYMPVVEALESLIADSGVPDLRERVREAAPLWFRFLDRDGAREPFSGVSGLDQRLRMEMKKLLEELSRERPVILFFDDWHWVDLSTVDLLSYLAGSIDRTRLLLIAAYRPSELLLENHLSARIKLDLESRGALKELPLDVLDADDTRDYLNFAFSGHAFPAEFSPFVHSRTGGHPLFLVGLVEYMCRLGMIRSEDRRWVLKQHPAEHSFPQSIRSLIDRKLQFLDDAEREILAAASIQGSEFESAVVAEVMEKPADDVEEKLAALEATHFLLRFLKAHVLPDGTPSRRYAFGHVLYQDAAFSGLSSTGKALWSRATAEALLRVHLGQTDDLTSQIAYLLEQADDTDRAADYYWEAAQTASRTAAYDEAIILAKRGLGLCETGAENPEQDRRRLKLLVALAETHLHLRTSDAMAKSIDYSRQAAHLAPDSAQAQALLAQGHILRASHVLGPSEEDIPAARRAALRAIEIDESMPHAHTALGYVKLLGDWDWPGSRRAFERAISRDPGYAPAYLGYAFYFIAIGEPVRALEKSEKALKLDPYSLIIRSQVGWMLYFCRRYHDAAAHLTATMELDPRFWRPYFNLGFCYLQLRRFDDAVRVLEQASMLNPNALTNAVLAQAYAAAGQREKAERVLDFLFQSGYASAYWTAMVHVALGDSQKALDYMEKSFLERECVLFILNSEPALEALRQDPGFKALFGRIGSTTSREAIRRMAT